MLWWKMFVPCQNRVPLKKSISSNLPQQIPMLLWKMFVFLPKNRESQQKRSGLGQLRSTLQL